MCWACGGGWCGACLYWCMVGSGLVFGYVGGGPGFGCTGGRWCVVFECLSVWVCCCVLLMVCGVL